MGKDTRVPIRVSTEQKVTFEDAAARDGTKNLSAWFRWLAEQRIVEQGIQQSNGAITAKESEPAAFIPGYGLEEGDT